MDFIAISLAKTSSDSHCKALKLLTLQQSPMNKQGVTGKSGSLRQCPLMCKQVATVHL